MIAIQLNGIGRTKAAYNYSEYVRVQIQEHGTHRSDHGPGEVQLLLTKDEFWTLFLELKAVAAVLEKQEIKLAQEVAE